MDEWTPEAVRTALERDAHYLPVAVSAVRLDGEDVVIEFTTETRPGCRFAYRANALPTGRWAEETMKNETPEMYATDIRVGLEENIEAEGYGLPEPGDSAPGELTWVSWAALGGGRS